MKQFVLLLIFSCLELSFNTYDIPTYLHDILFVEVTINIKVNNGRTPFFGELDNAIQLSHCSQVSYKNRIEVDSLRSKGFEIEKEFFQLNKKELNQSSPMVIMKYNGFNFSHSGDNTFVSMIQYSGTDIHRSFDRAKKLYNISYPNKMLKVNFQSTLIFSDTAIKICYDVKTKDYTLEISETHKLNFLTHITRKNSYFEVFCL
jgi:hypothetical protein